MAGVIVDDVTDVLPVAWYGTPDEPPSRHPLLGFAVLVIAVGASLAAPVAGALAVTAAVTVLRVAGRGTERHAARRLADPRRGRNLLVLLASLPWLAVWAAVETILLAPLVLLAAAGLVAGAVAATRAGHPALAGAAVAGLYTVLICLGPRSPVARRQLNRFLDPVARSPLTVGLVSLMLGAVSVGLVSFTVPGNPASWPGHGLRAAVVRLLDADSGPCQHPPPDTRLAMLCAAARG